MTTVVLVLAALGAALIGLLLVPADFVVSAGTKAGVRFRVRWLFGLVRVGRDRAHRETTPAEPPDAIGEEEAEPNEARKKQRRRSRPLRSARIVRGLMAIEGLIPRAGRLARELIQSPGWRRGRVAVRAGTGDPAGTGELCGLAGPLLVLLPRWPALNVQFEPDFAEAVFEAEAEAAGRFVPARLVGALGRFALSRPGLRAIKVLVWDSKR